MRRLSSLLVLLLVTFLAFQPILTRDVFADPILPGTFQMIAPSPGAVDVAPSPTLTWSASSSASGYGYCIDTTDDDACDGGDGGYIRVTDTQARPDLLPDTTYSWHVRAYNAAGFTPGGSWQQFTTAAAEDDSSQDSPSEPAQRSAAHTPPMAGAANESVLPGALSKTSPVDGSSDQSATVLLSWTAASEATSYGYCFDTTADNVCDDGGERGFRRIAGTSVRISGLELGTTYSWQVRAYNAAGHTQADGGQWASFTTAPVSILPADFTKLSPTDGITGTETTVTLRWSESADAAGYGYCINQNPGYACEGGDRGYIPTPDTSVLMSDLEAGAIYYWQVRAYNAAGDYKPADGDGQWASFTTAPEPVSRPIAFASVQDGNADIYVMALDGSEQARLTDDPADDSTPAWSPDGSQIAFTSNRAGNDDIYVMQADGSSLTRLTYDPADDSTPAWSPDGSQIAFTSNRAGNNDIYVMQADGSSQSQLTTSTAADRTPDWSSDGQRIVFTSERDSDAEVYVMQADGSAQTRLTSSSGRDADPAWSPDGRRIAFISERDGNAELYLMNADGSAQTRVTTRATDEAHPTWSPDGTRLMVALLLAGSHDLLMLRSDGTAQTRHTTDAANDEAPDWSPAAATPLPGAFGKTEPADAAAAQPGTLTLAWEGAQHAVDYGYCIDETDDQTCDSGPAGFLRVDDTDVVVNLEPNTTYYWQVRAYNAAGFTEANQADWGSFSTAAQVEDTDSFTRLSPPNGITNQPTTLTLAWAEVGGATGYGYCIDTTNDDACDGGDSGYVETDETSVLLDLEPDTTYYWQVRAFTSGGTVAANGDGAWWSLTTQGIQTPGYTPGEFGTNEAGAANYKVPLVVPEGTAGIAPELALAYDSRSGNSLVGRGWSLAGLSMIGRCPNTIAQHGFIDGVDFDEHDQFCLDGQLLVAVEGAYGEDGTIYRTENETFSKVVSYGTAGGGPERFQVWTQAGLIMEYGFTDDARIEAQGRPDVLSWALNRMEDTRGNYLTVSYAEDRVQGESYPTHIAYTGNDSQGLAPYARVTLRYEDRPDSIVQYVAGSATRMTKRLHSIRMTVDGALAHEYRLGYDVSTGTGRSRLVSLTECAGDGTCFASSRFDWSVLTSEEFTFRGEGSGKWQGHAGGVSNTRTGDFNGDGLTDMLGGYYAGSGSNPRGGWEDRVCLSTGSGFDCSDWGGADHTSRFVGDFNGDGLTDFAADPGNNAQWEVCLSTGSAFTCQQWSGLGKLQNIVSGDFNGDGRSDFLGRYYDGGGSNPRGEWRERLCLSTGSGFDCAEWTASKSGAVQKLAGDFNGDGLTDTANYRTGRLWDVCLSTGSTFICQQWRGHTSEQSILPGDFNGDGLTDMLGGTYASNVSLQGDHVSLQGDPWSRNWQDRVCLSTGNGFDCSDWGGPDTTSRVAGDFNGDGLLDIGMYKGTRDVWSICLSTGSGFSCATWNAHGGGTSNNVLGDYNGDGRTDMARTYDAYDPEWGVFLASGDLPDMLTTITNGSGVEIAIDYRPLTDNSVYTKDSGATYPDADIQAPMYVVAAHSSSDGIGGTRRVSYQYEGLKINRMGRGFLGFQSITSTDEETGIRSTTYYSQVHPYKSMVLKTEQRLANGTLIHSVENTWAVLSYNQFSQSNPQYRLALAGSPGSRAPPTDEPATTQPANTLPVTGSTNIPESSLTANSLVYLPLIQRGGASSPPPDPEPTPEPEPEDPLPPADPIEPDHSFGMPVPESLSLPDLPLDAELGPGASTLAAEHSSSSSLEQLRSPNTIGVTYFPYVRHSVVKKYELDGSLVYASTTNTEYDSYGNVAMIVVANSDGYAQTTYSSYLNDARQWLLGRLVESQVTAEAPGQPQQTRTSRFAYSAESGMLIREETEPDDPTLALIKTYWHDGYGNITHSATTDPAGAVQTVQQTDYDARGRFAVRSTNALGHSEDREYDELLGIQTRLTGPNGLATSWEYDSFGRATKETRADGTTTTTEYLPCAANDCPTQALYAVRTTATGAAPVTEYNDLLDRVVRQETVGFDGRPVSVNTRYNRRGQTWQVSEPYFGNTDTQPISTTYTYDDLGRVISQTSPDGSITSTNYQGLTIEVTNARGFTSSRTLNSQEQVVQSTNAYGDAIRYTYDAFGNLLEMADPAGNTTTMTYDLRGRKIAMQDPDMGSMEYRYNALDELVWQKDARGNEVAIVYDALGRVLGRREPEGTSIWTYDTQPHGIGKLAQVQGAHGYAESYTYDDLGRPTEVTLTVDRQTFTTRTSYDEYSRVASIIYPTGFTVTNSYTEHGYLEQVQGESGTAYWQASAINARGQIETALLGNGLASNYSYNPLNGRIAAIQTSDPAASSVVQNLAYEFDAVGNLTSRTDNNQNLAETFSYDNLNRLESAQVSGQAAQTVQYDALGNITNRSDVGDYTYGEQGAGPHAVTAITGVRGNTYTYDASGNRLTSATGSIAYTSFNVPERITAHSSTRRATFTYSPDHNRYKQVLERGSIITTTLYIGGLYEQEQVRAREMDDAYHTLHRHYIQGGDGVVAIYTQESDGSEQTLYLHRDHIGSVDTITDENGSIVEKLSYDAWGQRRLSSWQPAPDDLSSQVSRGFTGHEMLDEVGLIHMGGRVYEPQIGRFLSADPFVQAPENLQNLNRYSYVLNNPLSLVDPSGFFSIGEFFEGIGDAIGDAVDFIKDNWKTIAIIGLTIAAGWAAGMVLAPALGFAPAGAAIFGGAAGGFVGGFSGTLLYGGSLSQALQAGLRGAALGGLSAGMTYGIGSWAETVFGAIEFGSGGHIAKILAHGAVGGMREVAQGGRFEHGFLAAAAGESFAPYASTLSRMEEVAVSAMIGGTVAELSGGKFANGAVTAAFTTMYNSWIHKVGKWARDVAVAIGIDYMWQKSDIDITGNRDVDDIIVDFGTGKGPMGVYQGMLEEVGDRWMTRKYGHQWFSRGWERVKYEAMEKPFGLNVSNINPPAPGSWDAVNKCRANQKHFRLRTGPYKDRK